MCLICLICRCRRSNKLELEGLEAVPKPFYHSHDRDRLPPAKRSYMHKGRRRPGLIHRRCLAGARRPYHGGLNGRNHGTLGHLSHDSKTRPTRAVQFSEKGSRSERTNRKRAMQLPGVQLSKIERQWQRSAVPPPLASLTGTNQEGGQHSIPFIRLTPTTGSVPGV